jgi:hypothetical protein
MAETGPDPACGTAVGFQAGWSTVLSSGVVADASEITCEMSVRLYPALEAPGPSSGSCTLKKEFASGQDPTISGCSRI